MDGWDDDDDALAGLNDDDEEGKKEEEENGWGDNDDGLEDLSVDDNGDNGGCRSVVPLNLSATGAPATTTGPVDPATHRRASELSAKTVLNPNVKRAATATTGISGWELETEGTVWKDSTHSSVVAKEIRRSLPPIVDMTPAVDGWDDEDDLELDDDDDDDAPATVPLKHILTLEQDALYQKLQLYIQRLPHLVTSLNAVLEAEYNTTTHAMALLEYYAHRPQLMAYTVDVEVPRMDYRVKARDGRILTDKLLVQKHFKSQPNSILLRASNQSLLADILTVLQGDVICPQFLATAICTSCQFRMDDSTVDVECSMSLSLPNATGSRMNVATMLCHVMLDPTEPMVMYQIKQIVPAMDNHHDTTATLLQGTAMFLSEMACGMDDTNGMDSSSTSSSSQPTTADALRDQCLHQLAKTHYMAQQTSTGLSSALRQIDRVANVSNKVTALSKLIPTLPHATDLLHSEEQSPVNVATASQQRNNRPKPILGGFLMSGLSRLANTIVPDDSPEPSFYRKEESQAPMLYRKEEAKGAPSLYRKDEMHTLAPQAFYRQPDPPQRPAPRQNVDPPPPIPPAVQDGWDEDDEELNFDDDNDNGNEPVTKPLFESPARPVLSNMAAVTTPSNPSSYTSSATLEKPTLLNPPPPRPGRPTVSHGTFGGRTTNSQPPPPPPPPPPPVSKLPVSHGTFSGRTTTVKNSNLDPPLHVVVLEEDEDLVAPIPHQDYPPIPPPMLHYDPNDDIIPTRVRWTRSR